MEKKSEEVKMNATGNGPDEACGGGGGGGAQVESSMPKLDMCSNKQDKQDKVALTKDDFKRLLREYDDNGDGEMSDDEIARLLKEYR